MGSLSWMGTGVASNMQNGVSQDAIPLQPAQQFKTHLNYTGPRAGFGVVIGAGVSEHLNPCNTPALHYYSVGQQFHPNFMFATLSGDGLVRLAGLDLWMAGPRPPPGPSRPPRHGIIP